MVENKPIVVDASVCVKWFLEEAQNLEQAHRLLYSLDKREFKIFVPAHFFSELANVLSRKAPHQVLPSLSYLNMLGILQCFLSLELAFIVMKLIQKHPKISFYDAFYHALAIDKGAIFITADEKYYRSMRKEGHIMLLRDY